MKDIKKFLIVYIIIVFIFLLSFNKSIAKSYSALYIETLNLQKIAQKIFSSLKKPSTIYKNRSI